MRYANRSALVSLLAVLGWLFAVSGATPAFGASEGAGWTLESLANPTDFSTSQNEMCLSGSPHCDTVEVIATNVGKRATSGGTVTLTDSLPAGLALRKVSLFLSGVQNGESDLAETMCTTVPLRCTIPAPIAPDERVTLRATVTVEPAAPSQLVNIAGITGGGAPAATARETIPVSANPPPFGISSFHSYPVDTAGRPDDQAGDHPYELQTRIALNTVVKVAPAGNVEATSVQELKDVVLDLPVGFVGSAVATPKCTLAQLSSPQRCPRVTAVGHIVSEGDSQTEINGPIYNLVPEHGRPAEFGYVDVLSSVHVLYAEVVPTPAGYALQITASYVPAVGLRNVLVTFYGNPSERDESGTSPIATLTNPGLCSGAPLTAVVHVDSWEEPGTMGTHGPNLADPRWVSSSTQWPAMTGCNLLQFDPSASVQPDSTTADSPSGLDVAIKVGQSEVPGTLATPPLKKAVVTLPPGLSVDPSAAGGLAACTQAQIGWLGGSLSDFTPDAPSCPDASKIGSVELTTPLLEGTLVGAIYIATQDENPFHSLLAGYIVVNDPKTGVIVKIPGELATNPQNGQITGTFDQNPQLPFSELKLHFFGGPRGDLATPEGCGSYTTTSTFEPWSAPSTGPAVTSSSSFQISSGCVSGFLPNFSAGTTNPLAGRYSPFVLSFSRKDSEEGLAGLSLSLPPGLLAKIAGVAQCPEAAILGAARHNGATEQASPSCPAGSAVGSVQTAAGPGPDPTIVSGKAYLTGPYKGAPYGLAVVVPALAGPFDLGTVVIRQALYIDPSDSHVTAVSDQFPQILDGIPLRLKQVNVTLDRPEFTLNPTSCDPNSVSGSLSSIGGAHAAVSATFQSTGCRELPFGPTLTAATQGTTSKAKGASLSVKVTQKPGEAHIRKVDLQLPIALPSRLTTLQKACTEAQFNSNPAGCPEGSFIGTAVARTPILNVPLTGPAILVSHGAAAFPDVQFLLQGEGVTIDLDGTTDIKKGVTYSRFETIPDAPISSFETILPEGPHSVLAANRNLCALSKTVVTSKRVVRNGHGTLTHAVRKVKRIMVQPLHLLTTIVGQNGARVVRTTTIVVAGCVKVKSKKTTRRLRRARSKRPRHGSHR